MKISCTFLLILCSIVQVSAQFTCGAIHKKALPDVGTEHVAVDRFNNAYTKEDFSTLQLNTNGSIQTGYFELFISDDLKNITTENHPNQGDDFSTVIEKVFSDVSLIINQRSHTLLCGDQIPQEPVKIIIGTDVCSGDDDCENATSLAAGVGSPFYGQFFLLSGIDETCPFVTESNVWLKMNAVKEYLPVLFDGIIHINVENPTINYGIDVTNPPVGDKIDLYSVVMHELLHVLGFTSRLTADGSAKDIDGFNFSFITRYDQLLHTTDSYQANGQSENVQSLTTLYLGSNCYQITDNVTDFTDLLANNCLENQSSIVFGENAIAPISGGINVDVPNALSHLSELCNGSSEDFVMDPNIQNGDDERDISMAEKQILCALGYDVVGVSCNSCFVHAGFVNYSASANEVSTPYYNSCCDEKFYTEVNVPLTFTKEDVFCNAIIEHDTYIDISDIYLLNTTGELAELTDDNYEFVSNQPGQYLIIYTLTNCNAYSSTAVLQINVHEAKAECPLDFICDNLVCNSDYEDYSATNNITFRTGFDNLYIFENTIQNTVDICISNANKVSTLANIFAPEGQLIPLLQPLSPGCTISISADLASREGSNGIFHISGSEYQPCLPTEAFITDECNTFGSSSIMNDCGSETYIPYCLITSDPIQNTHSGGVCPAENLTLETYTWEVEHTGDTDINYLIVHNLLTNSVLWVDNLIVIQTCPPTITVEALDLAAIVNETNVTGIEVCFGDPENFDFDGTTVEISIPSQPNFSILDDGDFVNGISVIDNLEPNSCQTIFLHFIPNAAGEIDFTINSLVSTLCKEEAHVFDMNVSDIMGNTLDQLDEIPHGSDIHYYDQSGMQLGCFPISHKEEVRTLYVPEISSVYAFTIVSKGKVLVVDKIYLHGRL